MASTRYWELGCGLEGDAMSGVATTSAYETDCVAVGMPTCTQDPDCSRRTMYCAIGAAAAATSSELRCQFTCNCPPSSAGTSSMDAITGPVLGTKSPVTHSG